MIKYYSTQRPLGPGCFPKQGAVNVVNFDDKQYCQDIGKEAWGYVEYENPLTDKLAIDYELTRERSFYDDSYEVIDELYNGLTITKEKEVHDIYALYRDDKCCSELIASSDDYECIKQMALDIIERES